MFFIGDLHLGHKKVSGIRGFASTDEHDNHILEQWIDTIKNTDRVFVMGDISSGIDTDESRALDILETMPGIKTLISGNHDSVSGIHRKVSSRTQRFREVFSDIHDYGRIRMNNRHVLLSHYPYFSQGDGPNRDRPPRYEWARLPDVGELLIHAHTHHTDPFNGSLTGREMCVSWDARRRITTIADVAKWVDSLEERSDVDFH